MSNLGPLTGRSQGRSPMPPRGDTIARYDTYLEAQRAVDYLSDNAFPVQFVTIVGTGLQMVERVTGRLTYPRVALAGAVSGAWFGLFVGLVLSLFGGTDAALLAGPMFGAAFGILFGVISYALTGGRRDFTSTSQIVASEYAVLCMAEHAGAARTLLLQLPGGTGRQSSDPGAAPGQGGPRTGAPSPWLGPNPWSGGAWPGGPSPHAGPQPGPHPGPPPGAGTPEPSAPGPAQQQPGAAEPGPAAGAAAGEPGLTYGEAIERQRRERREREEREERERRQRERQDQA